MLNIMVLAYEGVAVEDLPKTEVVEERHKQLFDAYIERMFRRPTRLTSEQQYSEAQSIRWLTWLAQRMVQQSQTVFFIEGMQPTWLQTKGKTILYRLGSFLIGGLIFGLISGLIFGIARGMKGSAITTKTIPNQGIYRTAMNAGIMGLIIGLIFGLNSGLFVGLISGLGLINGLIFGLIALILGGGNACIQHFTLRLILCRNGYIPWNYARFLDYAAERIFLQKVGGGYIFIHRLLLEHFAQMKLKS